VENILKRLVSGAAAGVGATVAMSAFMLLAGGRGWLNEQAPRAVTRRLSHKLSGDDPDDRSLDAVTVANHLAMGAGYGTLYAFTLGRIELALLGRVSLGSLYGAAIWLVMYGLTLPALRLMPSPQRDQRRRPEVMLAAHLIFGGTLGALTPPERWQGDLEQEEDRASHDFGSPGEATRR
jgi:hypothetical protein